MRNTLTIQSIENKILSRINGHGRGWAFTAHDFSREFKRSSVDWSLSDLAKKNKIRRVGRGVYDFPKYSELLKQELSPDFDQVAQAIARKFNWRIQATGDAALNLLGVSTQVPGKVRYLSDGPNRSYQFTNTSISFKKAALKEIGFKYKESGLVVHGLKALGKQHITNDVLTTIREHLDTKKCNQIMDDTKTVTNWVYETIRKICNENN